MLQKLSATIVSLTSFSSEGKLNSIASHPTECVDDQLTLKAGLHPQSDVLSNPLWGHGKPALCRRRERYSVDASWPKHSPRLTQGDASVGSSAQGLTPIGGKQFIKAETVPMRNYNAKHIMATRGQCTSAIPFATERPKQLPHLLDTIPLAPPQFLGTVHCVSILTQ